MDSYTPPNDDAIEALIAAVKRERIDTDASGKHRYNASQELHKHRYNTALYIKNELPSPHINGFIRSSEVDRQVRDASFKLDPKPSVEELMAAHVFVDARMSGDKELIALAKRNLRILAVMENRDTNFDTRLQMIESSVDKALADIPDKRMEKIAEGHGETTKPKPGFMEKYFTPNLNPKTQIR